MARTPADTNRTSYKQLSRRIHVTVMRDITSRASTTIWQHEKPILEALFGEGNIEEVPASTLDEGYTATIRPDMLIYNKTQDKIPRPSEAHGIGFVFIGNAESEYERLAKAYGRLPEEKRDTVEVVYGRAAERKFSGLLGNPTLEDLPDGQLRALILDYGYAPIPHKDASADEKNAIFKLRRELGEADSKTLVALAESLGVQVG